MTSIRDRRCLQKGANARNEVETSKKALVLQSLPYIMINTHDVASCKHDSRYEEPIHRVGDGFWIDGPRASWWLGKRHTAIYNDSNSNSVTALNLIF